MPKIMSSIVVLILALSYGSDTLKAQSPSDQQAIKTVFQILLQALEKRDCDAAMASWSGSATERDSYSRWTLNICANPKDQQFSNVTYIRWQGDVNQVWAYIRLDVIWHQKGGIESGQDQTIWAVRFINEKGVWKWSTVNYVLLELVEKLCSANTREERMNLLQRDREILSIGITQTLSRRSNQLANDKNYKEAIRLNEIALEVAPLLKDKSETAFLYLERGDLFSETNADEQALKAYESARQFAEDGKDKRQEVLALGQVGRIYLKTNQYPEAVANLEKAAALGDSFGIIEGKALILGNLAGVYGRLGRYQEALTQSDHGLLIARETQNRDAELQVLAIQSRVLNSIVAEKLSSARTKEDRQNLLEKERDTLTVGVLRELATEALLQADKHSFEEALRLNGIALEVADFLKRARESADLYDQRGQFLSDSGAYKEASKAFESAIGFYQKSGNADDEAEVRYEIADVLRKSGAYPDALEQIKLNLKRARDQRDPNKEAEALGNIGTVYMSWAKYAEAFSNLQEALRINQGSNNQDLRAGLLNNIGLIYRYEGNYEEALNAFKQSQRIAEDNNYLTHQGRAIANAGSVYAAMGNYLDAVAESQKAFNLGKRDGNRDVQAMALNNLAIGYTGLGSFKDALEQCENGLKIARLGPDRTTEAQLLATQAWVYAVDDQHLKSVESLKKWVHIPGAFENKEVRGFALFTMAFSTIMTDETTPDLEEIVSALEETAKEVQSSVIRLLALQARGASYGTKGEWKKVIPLMETTLKESPPIELEAGACFYLGLAYQHQKEWKLAGNFYRKAVDLVEKIRSDARDPMLQASLFSIRRSPYFGLAKSLLELGGNIDEVIRVSEQAKSRSLLDLLNQSKIRSSKSLSDADNQKKQELVDKITTIRADLDKVRSAGDSGQIETLKQQLSDAQRAAEMFEHIHDAQADAKTTATEFEPVTLDILKERIFDRYPNLCLLSYFVENDETMLLAITKGKDPKVPVQVAYYPLKDEDGDDLTEKVLEQRLLDFRLRLATESGIYRSDANALYQLLIGPAKTDISGKSHVIIIPDQALNTLPFQALIDSEGNHLIDRFSVSYAPSITALIKMMSVADQRRQAFSTMPPVFALGRGDFPDNVEYRTRKLPWAEGQAKSIAELFGVRPFIGSDATRSKVIAEMGKARYIHFATHGDLNEVAPMYSAILLGKSKDDDGMLYAGDLMNLHLNAELVTLSACNTALGKQVNGEGLLGLTWALFIAGAPSSVVTEWSVRDDSMNKLMLEFYRQLRDSESGGALVSKAEALRRAEMSLMKNPKYNHPCYWAPTVLTGDWR